MLTPNRIYFIFIVFMVMCCVSQSFWLHTEKSLTAVRGRNISLPCNFSVFANSVYWYKHNYTGAPDDEALLVARDFFGYTDPLQGFERFSITNDYSLFIRNITVHDETTYSCLVVDIATERGYTNLRVIALAEPLEPIIESCNVTAPGRCIYTVGENSPEDVTQVCLVHNVRPPPDLTWIGSDGRVPENATQQMHEKDGLFNISSQIQVTKADFDKQFTCEANGDAVNGTSSMKIAINEGDVTKVSHDRGVKGGLITSIFINFILLLFVLSQFYYKNCGPPSPLRAVELQNSEPLGDIESQLLTDQEELTAKILSQKIEALENERKEDRSSFVEKKREIESKLQKILHDQVEKVKTQAITVNNLIQKIEALENEKNDDRASFEEEKREIETNWQKIVNVQAGKLKTQELTVTQISQKIEVLENERKEDPDSFEEEKREMKSKLQKILHDQVEKLKTQEHTVTKLRQEMKALENNREIFQAKFEKQKLAIELELKKQVESLHENVDELVNGNRSRGNPKPAEDRKDFDEIFITVAKRFHKDSEIYTLGTNLGFNPRRVQKYIATNHRIRTWWIGTLEMLQDWQKRQEVNTVRDGLKEALEKSGQTCIADEIFPSQRTVTKLRQEIEALENNREIFLAKFEKEKIAIELELKKQEESLHENVDKLENGNRSRGDETDDNRA